MWTTPTDLKAPGRHLVKGGIGYQYALNDIDSRYPGGYVDIFWGTPMVFPGRAGDRGAYGYYTVTNRGLFGKAGADIVSLYLQDQWQIAHNLTFNVGIRVGKREGSCVQDRTAEVRIRFRFWREDRSAFGIQLRRLWSRAREALRKLGPLFRLDEVLDGAQPLRR